MQNQFTLTLSATQADTLEDALLTFAPGSPLPAFTATGGAHVASVPADQLPQLVDAITRYRRLITDDRTTRGLVAKLEKIQGETPRA